MDSMEVNKGIAAILIAGIAFFLTGLIGDNLVRETLPEKPVLNIATAPAAGAAAAAPEQVPPIAPLLAKADVKTAKQFTHRVCIACHTFDKGAKPGIGPNLYGVVGGPHDHEEGFNYSPAPGKVQGSAMDLRRSERMAAQAGRRCARHAHDVRRHSQYPAARGCHCLSAVLV